MLTSRVLPSWADYLEALINMRDSCTCSPAIPGSMEGSQVRKKTIKEDNFPASYRLDAGLTRMAVIHNGCMNVARSDATS